MKTKNNKLDPERANRFLVAVANWQAAGRPTVTSKHKLIFWPDPVSMETVSLMETHPEKEPA
jgi:hypothetical protein